MVRPLSRVHHHPVCTFLFYTERYNTGRVTAMTTLNSTDNTQHSGRHLERKTTSLTDNQTRNQHTAHTPCKQLFVFSCPTFEPGIDVRCETHQLIGAACGMRVSQS